MAKAFSNLRLCMTPESQLRSQFITKQLLNEMPLSRLRYARELTQTMLAEVLDVPQRSVSNLEKQADTYLSALRTHIKNMGGELEITARFPEGSVNISKFSDLENETESSGSK